MNTHRIKRELSDYLGVDEPTLINKKLATQ
jgi:hypothetical protein